MSVPVLSPIEAIVKAFQTAIDSNDINAAIDAINKQVEKIPSSKSYIINHCIQMCMQTFRIDFVSKILDAFKGIDAGEIMDSIMDTYQERQIVVPGVDGAEATSTTISKMSNDLEKAMLLTMPPAVNTNLAAFRDILQLKVERQLHAKKHLYSLAEADTKKINEMKAKIQYKTAIQPAITGFFAKSMPGYALANVKDIFIYRRLKALRAAVARAKLQVKDIQHVFQLANLMCKDASTVPEVTL